MRFEISFKMHSKEHLLTKTYLNNNFNKNRLFNNTITLNLNLPKAKVVLEF